jgi:serine/threonine protein kinase
MGSRNWMAPELLLGGSLKMPCDIYAFGMTLYEVSLLLMRQMGLRNFEDFFE